MNIARELVAYVGLALLAVLVLCAGVVAAILAEGVLTLPAAAAAVALTFQALRRVTGRIVGAAVDSIQR
jgi:hypothetical protein